MSTRKLILLALACGLAILVAGSVQLLRIQRNESSTLAVGDSTEAATVTASVVDTEVTADAVLVTVRVGVADTATTALEDAQVGWSLLTGGLKEPVEAAAPTSTPVATSPSASSLPSPCAGLRVVAGESAECVLSFAVVPGGKGTTFVSYRFAGQKAVSWSLPI